MRAAPDTCSSISRSRLVDAELPAHRNVLECRQSVRKLRRSRLVNRQASHSTVGRDDHDLSFSPIDFPAVGWIGESVAALQERVIPADEFGRHEARGRALTRNGGGAKKQRFVAALLPGGVLRPT